MKAGFFRDRDGQVGLAFSLMLVPLIVLGGSGIDLSLVFAERSRAQNALDRAALAAAVDLGVVPNATVEANLRSQFAAFYKPTKGSSSVITSVAFDNAKGEVTATVDVTTETTFMQIANVPDMTSSLRSTVAIGISDFDVVMVLDNSGSMAGTKITTLKTAAKDLTATLLGMNASGNKADRVQIGVVPFAASVNVGAQFGPTYSGTTRTGNGTGAGWLDVQGQSPIHRENFVAGATENRFDLFAALAAARPTYASALTWGGCVESLPQPYDVSDTAPSAATPETLIVPMFAPDEPGYYSSSNGYWVNPSGFYNNYLDDNGGTCTTAASSSSNTALLEAQGRTCKYKSPTSSEFRNASSLGTGFGPNYSCTTKPIRPMTTSEATLDTYIDSLAAGGNTNIHEGVMWGWRTLSAAAPFTEGRTASAERPLKKIMIVMTDGENTYTTSSNVNKSSYAAYGYVSKGRLGTTSTGMVKTKQDERTALACSNAKSQGGIVVYTIAFQVTAQATIDLLAGCASGSSFAYKAEDNAQLIAVFQQIAKEISQLRVAR